MSPDAPALSPPTLPFTADQWQALAVLRQQYRQHRDCFSSREVAHLRFLRWLYQTGRLVP